MEKRIAVIEITNREVRLIIGDVVNDKPVVLYQTSRPINGLISRGEILDENTLSQIIASLGNIADEKMKTRLRVSEATLILPPSGLSVYQTDKTTNVVSSNSIIESIDIQNVISLVVKEEIPGGNEIVDIVPDYFLIQSGRTQEPPLGKTSNFLTLKCKIYALPARIIRSYRKVLESANIRAKRLFVSPYGTIELVKQTNEFPKDYFLIDMGAQTSSISLVGNHSLFASNTFTLGGEDLINYVAEEFQIPFDDAHELVEIYGINERKLTYRPVIASAIINGVQVQYSPDDLNRVIIDFFANSYFKQLDVALKNLVEEYSRDSLGSLPIIFTGGFSKLHGFDRLAKEKFAIHQSINYLEPDVIGARNASLSSLVGALLASSKYKGTLSDQRARVSPVDRVDANQQ